MVEATIKMVDYLVLCVAMLSGCCVLLCLIAVSLLMKLRDCCRAVASIVSEVRPFANTDSSAITKGTNISGDDSRRLPHLRSDDVWAALACDARAVVALCLGWLASRC